jgi:endonuclease/exonuclease/phosphatase family metal-dependent hydrolase
MRRFLALGVTAAVGLTLFTAPPAAAAGTLVFASYNVCGAKPGPAQCTNGATPWESRREKSARVIAESGADVLGLQEVNNQPTAGVKTHTEDVTRLIAPAGYVPVTIADADNECRRPRDAAGQLAGPSPCETTAMLAYKSSTVSQFATPQGSSAGRVMLQSIAGPMDPGSATRSVEWGYLKGNNGAGPFLAISLHTDSDKGAGAEAARIAVGNALAGWVTQLNASRGMTGTPVILMADLNSYAVRQPNGIQKVLTNAGWIDAFTAKVKKNVQYPRVWPRRTASSRSRAPSSRRSPTRQPAWSSPTGTRCSPTSRGRCASTTSGSSPRTAWWWSSRPYDLTRGRIVFRYR